MGEQLDKIKIPYAGFPQLETRDAMAIIHTGVDTSTLAKTYPELSSAQIQTVQVLGDLNKIETGRTLLKNAEQTNMLFTVAQLPNGVSAEYRPYGNQMRFADNSDDHNGSMVISLAHELDHAIRYKAERQDSYRLNNFDHTLSLVCEESTAEVVGFTSAAERMAKDPSFYEHASFAIPEEQTVGREMADAIKKFGINSPEVKEIQTEVFFRSFAEDGAHYMAQYSLEGSSFTHGKAQTLENFVNSFGRVPGASGNFLEGQFTSIEEIYDQLGVENPTFQKIYKKARDAPSETKGITRSDVVSMPAQEKNTSTGEASKGLDLTVAQPLTNARWDRVVHYSAAGGATVASMPGLADAARGAETANRFSLADHAWDPMLAIDASAMKQPTTQAILLPAGAAPHDFSAKPRTPAL